MNAIVGIDMAMADARAQKISSAEPKSTPAGEAGIEALMRELFQKKLGTGGIDTAAATDIASGQAAPPRRDFDMATELLDRASHAFDLLINRCQMLEQDLNDANDRAEARAAEQGETIEQWKRLAAGLKTQAGTSEQEVALLKARCDAAEGRAAAAEQKVVALERASVQAAGHAARAEQLSTKLHDKVVSVFGIGSRAHPVLEAVVTKAAAE